jgi:hypothetical protein
MGLAKVDDLVETFRVKEMAGQLDSEGLAVASTAVIVLLRSSI